MAHLYIYTMYLYYMKFHTVVIKYVGPEDIRNDHVLRQKCCAITFILYSELLTVIFKGDLMGSPSKTGMIVISN